MANEKHLQILKQGFQAWNKWRKENHKIIPDFNRANLRRADLFGANLIGANLIGANLREANLREANLSGANLSEANLRGADLVRANLSGANLREADLNGANLSWADLSGADLVGANLSWADLSGANLREANLIGADLNGANLREADLSDAKVAGVYYSRSILGNYYTGAKVESCRGNPVFIRDVEDQQYIDAVAYNLMGTPWGRVLLVFWKLTDYGRSLRNVAIGAFGLSLLFGTVFAVGRWLKWGLLDYTQSAQSWLTPFYYSVVTYTTLGFGDVIPASWIGEILVIIEVILGYVTLGLLLAILANKVARRS